MNLQPWILPTLLLFIVAFTMAWRAARMPVRHRWRRRQARVIASQLQGRDRDQPVHLIYARLRAMDPLAFEELLLECLERRGHAVTRNRRYTGDGGSDGRVAIGREILLIQAKRYAGAIRPEHVADFIAVCRARQCRGLFIHTGCTGPQSRQHLAGDSAVVIVSGADLIALLRGDPVVFFEESRSPKAQPGTATRLKEARR